MPRLFLAATALGCGSRVQPRAADLGSVRPKDAPNVDEAGMAGVDGARGDACSPGASRDGCGRCTRWPSEWSFSVGGGCQAQLDTSTSPEFGGIAADGANVYWTTFAGVKRAPLGGGAVVTLAVAPSSGRVVADGTRVYFTANDGAGACRPHGCGAVMKVPTGGGVPVTLSRGQSYFNDLAVDSSSIYWTSGSTLMKAPIEGGRAETLAALGERPTNIAVGAAYVYWADRKRGDILAVPVGGGPSTRLATKQDAPSCVTIDGTSIYWRNDGHDIVTSHPLPKSTSGTAETLMKAPLQGGTPTTLASADPNHWSLPCVITVDRTHVYWTDGLGSLLRIPSAGGVPVTLSRTAPPPITEPRGIAVSSEGVVYWTVSVKEVDEEGQPTIGRVWTLTPE